MAGSDKPYKFNKIDLHKTNSKIIKDYILLGKTDSSQF